MAKKKVMICVDEGLLAEIEDYAAKMHLNRSASITFLCSMALQFQERSFFTFRESQREV